MTGGESEEGGRVVEEVKTTPSCELVVSFPPDVQAAIEAVLPSSDPLDQVSKMETGCTVSLTLIW